LPESEKHGTCSRHHGCTFSVRTTRKQKGLQIPPLQAGLVFLRPALTFEMASRHSSARAKHRGTLVLIEAAQCRSPALRRW
jgi:hypothetical protein